MKKTECQKCRPLSAVQAYVRNVEGSNLTAYRKAGVDKESNAEQRARFLHAITRADNSFKNKMCSEYFTVDYFKYGKFCDICIFSGT